MQRVAVIGAGLAGLTCAQALQADGWRVTVFEKSRGPGGRLSTRRTQDAQYDHGAQYFTVRDPQFARFIEQMQAQGSVAVWQPRLAQAQAQPWYVGTPGMSALGRAQAQGLDLRTETRVVGLQQQAGLWQLSLQDQAPIGGFDAVVVALPNEQAQPLLQPHAAHWAQALANTPMQACWTMMFSTEASLSSFDAGTPSDTVIGWWARNSSKPGRPVSAAGHDWVVQATAPWSHAHLQSTPEQVGAALLQAMALALDVAAIEPLKPAMLHRWLYARRTPDLPELARAWWSPAQGLGVCGDGLWHSRVEQAYLSGLTLAQQMCGQTEPH